MKRFGKYIYVLILIFYSAFLHAQVKITDGAVLTMDNNSLLELESTNKGLLIPRISINDLNNASPLTAPIPEGMMVYSNGGTVNNGFYYWTGSKWANFTTGISIPSGTTNYAAYWSDAQTIAAEQYLNITRGGTGIGTAPTDGQLLIGNGLGYSLANISGTLNRLSVNNGAGSIALDIDANYIGQASITTLGTITSGIWNSTPIGLAYGGTNTDLSASAAVGDILYANTATSFARLADVALGNVLLSGGVGAAPSWGKINLTSHISGVLPIINGGTNSSAVLNNNRIMVSSGDAIIEAPALLDGQLLIGSSAALPVASTLTGTLNQVNITNGAGTITLSTPQDIHTGASPTFSGLNLSGLTASKVVFTDASKNFTSTGTVGVGQGGTGLSTFGGTNTILYTTSADNLSNISTANTSALITNSTGIPSFTSGTTANRLLRTDGTTISFAQADLTSDVTGLLPLTNGGTNSNLTATNGGIVWSNASQMQISSAGTSGQALISGGTGSPTWFAPTTGSVIFAGTSGILSEDNTNFFWDNTNKYLGLGIALPTTNLHLYENNTEVNSSLLVEQGGTGDATQRYLLTGGQSITVGIDNDDNDNYKISNTTSLTGTTYSDANTMLRVHTEAGSEGIIDFNNQSRARANRSAAQSIPNNTITIVQYNNENYDSKSEYNTGTYTFTALEDGYYFVNAALTFQQTNQLAITEYIYLAVYVDGNNYAYLDRTPGTGNNNIIYMVKGTTIVYATAGQTIDIRVYQNSGTSRNTQADALYNYFVVSKIH